MTLRFSTTLLMFFFALLGVLLFRIKYTVADLETTHKALRHAILNKSEEIHVLNAEWTFLNEPTRLRELAKKYLPHLKPIRGEQILPFDAFQNSGLGEYDRKELEDVLKKSGRHPNFVSSSEK
ncbi:hypothetical protein AGMMS49949_06010 [Alphaproteobacteria bacterium]|nr:hypothetical protein AGMMS49949_06010 [Alphaproteobacteria bacterium]GHS97592.1 hypothetical protein AGMMS50296_4700 [Alphaproteobacteria bacterium]